jgi:hypothetical protein
MTYKRGFSDWTLDLLNIYIAYNTYDYNLLYGLLTNSQLQSI